MGVLCLLVPLAKTAGEAPLAAPEEFLQGGWGDPE